MCEYAGGKPVCAVKVTVRKFALMTDRAFLTKGLSLSIPVRTRKMVNYA